MALRMPYGGKSREAKKPEPEPAEGGKWVSMELDDESKLDAIPVNTLSGKSVSPEYPYGLKISLCDEQIDKLALADEVDAGDYVMFTARACVTNVSTDKMADGSKYRRVELQIEKIKVLGVEDEDDEEY